MFKQMSVRIRFAAKHSVIMACGLLAVLLLAPAATAQESLAHGRGEYLRWEAPQAYAGLAQRLSGEAEESLIQAHSWLGLDRGEFGQPTPRPGILYWVQDRQAIAAHLGRDEVPEWYAAVARPLRGDMVIAVKVAGEEARLRSTLRHEIVHHAMGALGADVFVRLPAWFHEGLAEAFSGEVYLGNEVGGSLSWRAASGALSPLSDFREAFPRDPIRAAEGYALGFRFVQRLIRIYGPQIVGDILVEVRAGKSLDAALIELTGDPIVTHEEALRTELRSLRSLVAESSGHVATGLFLLAAVLVPFALRRRRLRSRALEEKWAEQEEHALRQRELEAEHANAVESWMRREDRRPPQ